ncbi:agmatine deiminase family protein [Thiomicrolovo sp. ZZH C-3]
MNIASPAVPQPKRLPAEFEPQSFVQLIFPHATSDWAPYLDEACLTFARIAEAVSRYQPCLIVCDDIDRVQRYVAPGANRCFTAYKTDDTWARDCSGITVETETGCLIQDFTFTGWGGKFEAARDSAMTAAIAGCYDAPVASHRFILEGGGIESNGEGVLLVTEACLLNPNRNTALTSRAEIEAVLSEILGVKRTLWLTSGYLAGDDTDSHIDTLARFCDADTICYVKCTDTDDEHYEALQKMEQELRALRNDRGEPFRLVPLPMTQAIHFEDERLPATYANFLIINGAVLVPVYNDPHDDEALAVFRTLFPDREVIGIDCSVLIRQHGSLHCVTMQFPACVTLNCPQ